ncbi:MAG TPA: response regulator [Steroidobacteraceae bacterium]
MATILVVDDNAINRKLLVALLSGDGHVTLEASDGAEGLKVAGSEQPQLIISDVLMPTMDGYAFVRALRRDAALRGTPVIFYTAHYHEREAQNLAQSCGVSHVLVKPCPNEEILRTVEQVLAGMAESEHLLMSDQFDREHVQLLTNKLSERATALAASNARFTALTELNLECAFERDPVALLERVCAGVRHLLAAKFAVLAIADDLAPNGVFFTTSGIDLERLPLRRPDLHAGALGRVLSSRQPWRSSGNEAAEDPGLPHGYPAAKAYLGVPIMSPRRVCGWLCLADKLGGGGFDHLDERLLLTLAALACRSHENIRLQREVERHHRSLGRCLAVLGGVGAAISQAHDRDEACQEACRLMTEVARYRLAFVEISPHHGESAQFIAAAGEHSEIERIAWKRRRERAGSDDLVELALTTEAVALCNDLRATQLNIRLREELVARGYRAMAVLPLSSCILGRMILLSDEAGIFDQNELSLLTEFSAGLSLGIAQLSERLPVAS